MVLFLVNLFEGLLIGWELLVFICKKIFIEYCLVEDNGCSVLYVVVDCVLFGLCYVVDIDINKKFWLIWSWKVVGLIFMVDFIYWEIDDLLVCIVLVFDGDYDKFLLMDIIFFDMVKLLIGYELFYVMLMYVWDFKVLVGMVIVNGCIGCI